MASLRVRVPALAVGGSAAMILLAACGSAGASPTHAPSPQNTSPARSTTSLGQSSGPGSQQVKGQNASEQGPAVYGWGAVWNPQVAGNRGPQLASRDHAIRIKGIKGRVVQISTSNSDGYALTASGAVYAWGAASQGELGNGVTRASWKATRVDLPLGVKITSLPNPEPYDGALAIDSQGKMWAWGDDDHSQFCLNSTANVMRPVLMPVSDVTQAVGASRHTLFQASGQLEGCGWNVNGDLGDGRTRGNETSPVRVKGLPVGGQVKSLEASWGNEGVLYANGTYWNWGFNRGGQDGVGNTKVQTRAVQVSLPATVAQVSEGGSLASNGTTMALTSSGQIWLWGNGQFGQIGDGKTVNQTTATILRSPANTRFVMVNSGGAACYALDQQGQLWAWGYDRVGQLGIGHSHGQRLRPTRVHHLRVSQISSTAGNVAGLS